MGCTKKHQTWGVSTSIFTPKNINKEPHTTREVKCTALTAKNVTSDIKS